MDLPASFESTELMCLCTATNHKSNQQDTSMNDLVLATNSFILEAERMMATFAMLSRDFLLQEGVGELKGGVSFQMVVLTHPNFTVRKKLVQVFNSKENCHYRKLNINIFEKVLSHLRHGEDNGLISSKEAQTPSQPY